MVETNNNFNKDLKEDREEFMDWIRSIVMAIIIAILIKTFILSSAQVNGESMYPTLYERDRLFTLKFPLYYKIPERYDVVIFQAPDELNKDYIKRVIGLPGDKVQILHGNVYINDEEIKEDYVEEGVFTQTYTEDAWYVGKDEVFVLGDNRRFGASKDSRYFGTIKIESIKGIANFRYFPINKNFGNINRTS